MKKHIAILSISVFMFGCTSNEMAYYLTHPNASTNNPAEAAVYVAAALLIGEYQEDCSSGHPEDQITCKHKKEKQK